MKFKGYDYQDYAINFIKSNLVAAVFLDMGLGKTIITLSAIKDLINENKVKKVLVIAPLRVAKNTWPSEIHKWDHLSNLSYSVVLGTEKERKDALKKKADIYIINRENVDWLINKSGFYFDFDMLVIDELSSFKSWSSKRYKSLLKVRPRVTRVVGLTGTPSSNGLMDLFAQFRILDLGTRLGKYITEYRNNYFLPDKRNANVIFSWKLKPFAEEIIYERISDITISMKAVDYLKMPELILNEVKVELDDGERKVYNQLKEDMIVSVEDAEIDAVNAATLSNKLLQMANGSIYDEDKNIIHIHDKKLDALEDLIEQANGKPILVAYWFKHDLEKIKRRFNAQQISTNFDIQNWNEGKIQIGLIQPQSVGMGINLQTGGSILIWYGLTWSLELYEQTNARLWRQGQKENVVVHHIVTKDTIDESVMSALQQKEKVQNALIDAVKAEVRR